MRHIIEIAVNGNIAGHKREGVGIEGRISPTKDEIREGFRPVLDYRLLKVGLFEGISFVDDSFSTNVNSAWWALEETGGPIIWIAGGVDKGNNYSVLLSAVEKKVKAIVALGRVNDRLRNFFSQDVPVTSDCLLMDEAVMSAMQLAQPGYTVLLSPACASFDLFTNYEHRSREFRSSVARLACKSPTSW
ncbi:MAG: UDP-N-acetylmuramoylalanine--D-glutamate ligase [Patescibacteria group bacterium]|jgi:UDP-N-acetylmuramoylalanine--D-glutamate ligase|nr:UDP-N-acetylmuramoylalanine--D-glutamate ligase [Patescibacteria group bacterium]